jgi:hypothetical protein
VFGQLQTWQRNPDTIRRLLTHALIPATDRKALFVGLDAYTAAGGIVQRDLFSEDRGGWITDVALLERLVAERMNREAEAIRAEGWHRAGSTGSSMEPAARLAGQGGAICRGWRAAQRIDSPSRRDRRAAQRHLIGQN